MLYRKSTLLRLIAKSLICLLTIQLIAPLSSYALTSGPSQPEVQSFEPVGTTDMVDLFTGDFVYNIPLLDIEGYPVNISYHSGGDMEQEASWVGLGWNINPGVINRSVRGLPDDFNGETIDKKLNIKPEKNIRIGTKAGAEVFGVGDPILNLQLSVGPSLTISNYKGVSADFEFSAGVNVFRSVSAGINLGISSQGGASIDYNIGVGFASSQIVSSGVAAGVGFNYGHGYNTRSGVKDRTFSFSSNVSVGGRNINGPGFTASVPIGVKNIVPVITNKSKMKSFRGQLNFGLEAAWCYGFGAAFGMASKLTFEKDGSRSGYGYLYADKADDNAIRDFTRDKDGLFNETMPFMPLGNMTYDVYSVSGQGTGGSYRPFRNDFGSVGDPVISSTESDFSIGVEAGMGWSFEIGTDGSSTHTDISSGPWDQYKRPYQPNTKGSIYESTYFKQAGELTPVNPDYYSAIGGASAIKGTVLAASLPLTKPGAEQKRDPRGNLMYYLTAEDAVKQGAASSGAIYSYTGNGFAEGAATEKQAIPRISSNRKAHHISEVVQVQTDGSRYIYGIPAMNNSQKEVTFATGSSPAPDGTVSINGQDNTNNSSGRDHFYSATSTPAYAHSYLLTDVLSADYVDITGDGPSDDDFGRYTKFNYTLKDANYHWKAPYGTNKAQYDACFKSDTKDDRASYLEGTREQWMLHSIETKNFIGEFYTSAREDGKGQGQQGSSYKLDSIKLYNKHDRFINLTNAVPVKTVIFNYDYSLCQNVPNNFSSVAGQKGKLTLKKIMVRYGNSDRSMISPYQFEYDHNYNYSLANKDRWGAYKPSGSTMSNADYPFVDQDDENNDAYAAAWSLSKIKLPSGGEITLQYEADDYAFVQNKAAMEMFKIKGIGNSPAFSGANSLYIDKMNPNLYFYFKRKISKERPGVSLKTNYIGNEEVLYYNLDTRLVDNKYEPVKGYAEIAAMDVCPDNADYGYIKLKPVIPQEGGVALLNPASYTAINFARYYLPHIIFPGQDPDQGGLANIIAGLFYSFTELISMGKNPVVRMVKEGKAKDVKLARSYIRLNSTGLKKKGGGQRVKAIRFSDKWDALAGGNAQEASYGKQYEYTTDYNNGYGVISSGVASYEPMIGGDENPFRLPVNYEAQGGSHFPPNDPIGLYSELPIGESLYPAPVVGYSKVTVKSIHQEEGHSSQGVDIHEFYTAKDFPIKTASTPLTELENSSEYSFLEQRVVYKGTQGYTLVFNDMHGKPKRTEHRVLKPNDGSSTLISYTQYKYGQDGANTLSNTVDVMEYDQMMNRMKKVQKQVGIEADVTIDTRKKDEETSVDTWCANLNTVIIAVVPIPIPWLYYWPNGGGKYINEFGAVVGTKIIQQYGILKEVESYNEGAVTVMRNEVFDANTGQPVITSVNNEYGDQIYNVNYPAYWGYKSMGPSYVNTGYEEHFDSVPVSDYEGELPTGPTVAHYRLGDELLISYKMGGNTYVNNVWVVGFRHNIDPDGNLPECFYWPADSVAFNQLLPDVIDTVNITPAYTVSDYAHPIIQPRFKYSPSWPANGTLQNMDIKIIRSGAKNQLTETIQSYATMELPLDNNNCLKETLDQLISITAREYSDSLTARLPQFDSANNPGWNDSLNVYVNGTKGINRLYREYAYMKNRNYPSNTVRKAGLFSARSIWRMSEGPNMLSTFIDSFVLCRALNDENGDPIFFAYQHMYHITGYLPAPLPSISLVNAHLYADPSIDDNWVAARTITKWTPWGQELENKDAIGNYTSAIYSFNHSLPTALAQNARQQELLYESFEDYDILQVANNMAAFSAAYFSGFPLALLAGTTYYARYGNTGTQNSQTYQISATAAHTGKYSLKIQEYDFQTSGWSFYIGFEPPYPQYKKFRPFNGKNYILSYWFRPQSVTGTETTYAAIFNGTFGAAPKLGPIIEGWQKAELIFRPTQAYSYHPLPANCYIDDIRVVPYDGNMKSFVYNPINQKLVATLDENNFATFYEYDQEGNLVRTKKETEKGIMTISESRSANPKK